MPTTSWSPNGQVIAQVDSITITAVPGGGGGTLTFTMNGKSITYTTLSSDSTSTAASALQALLAATQTVPPEFNEVTYTVALNVITATAGTPGTPFTLTTSSGGGATLSQVHTTVNSSNSDVNNPANWLRAGVAAIPVNGDDVIVNNTNIPLLWNLDKLVAVQFNSYTRWQSFTGAIGLPENNPLGYIEYRPTYFQFTGPPAGTLTMVLGQGQTGSGPTRERYNVGAQQTYLTVLGAGTPIDAYSIRFLGTSSNNTLTITALGAGVTFTGGSLLSAISASAYVNCGVSSITADGSVVTVQTSNITYPLIKAIAGSTVNWPSNSNITQLTMTTSSTFNKSGSGNTVIQAATIDGDTCQVNDPYNNIQWNTPVVVNNKVTSGPFTFGTGRIVKIT